MSFLLTKRAFFNKITIILIEFMLIQKNFCITMGKLIWKNAFSNPESVQNHSELIEKTADFVVKHRLAAPALLFLENFKPLNRLFGQTLLLFSPFAAFFSLENRLREVSDLLQSRENVEKLIERIDTLEDSVVQKK